MAPSTDWKESSTPDEAARFEGYAQQLGELQKRNAVNGRLDRALHAKGQLGLEAEFEVLPDLPADVRQGLFATPGMHRAYVRYSNGAGSVQSDRKPDVRGIAFKILEVPGKKLIPGMEAATTQDFLLIRSATPPFRTADEFVPFVLAAASPLTALPKLFLRFGIGRTLTIAKEAQHGFSIPMTPLAATRYFSALPNRFGPYAAKWSLVPRASGTPRAEPPPDPNYLADELTERLKHEPVVYDFQVQLFINEAKTPIEDASVEWSELDAPFVTIGRLTLVRQDAGSPRGHRIAAFVEKLSFDPWHALEVLRPLGNMMRARNAAYRVSTQARGAAPEPDGTETFD